jgi:hypothetical protein
VKLRRGLFSAACLLLVLAARARAAETIRIDDFEDVSAWSPHPADGVEMKLSADGAAGARALRFDFRFVKGGGYAVARRAVDLTLPANYAFVMRIRGDAPKENLELKLIDDTGENVWWCNRRDFDFPTKWQTLVTKKRQIGFAWGPIGGGEVRHVAAIEIAVTAGSGGHGTVLLDDFELRALPPPGAVVTPIASASSARAGHAAALAVDADSTSYWWAATSERHPRITLDLQSERELGGLAIDWVPGHRAARYTVEIASEPNAWQLVRSFRGGEQTRDYLRLPETDARYIRITCGDPPTTNGCAISRIRVMPIAWGATPESFLEGVAREAPRGDYPRSFSGQQSYWTVVGVNGDTQEGLMSEDGAVEVGKRGFSIEAFFYTDKKLFTWADAHPTASLAEHDLPIPTVSWKTSPIELEVTAFPSGAREASSLYLRYLVTNRSSTRQRATLYLAVRPLQVNPPTQFLNAPGGVSPIRDIRHVERVILVNDTQRILPLPAPDGFGATKLDQGDITSYLRRDQLPATIDVRDSLGFVSGAMAYRLNLDPLGSKVVHLWLPLHGLHQSLPPVQDFDQRSAEQLATEIKRWRAEWRGPAISLPASAAPIVETLHAQLGYILVNRDGPAIQPGSRSYERSWIRDGSLTSSALLRLGRADVVKEFLEWFAKYQYDDGKVPCCVDQRGADPVPELDSGGEFIFLVAEYVRYTGDRDLAWRLWPRVRCAAAWLDSLRHLRRTPEYRAAGKQEFFGLLPPSISHEGYSAKPMHSYWDDLFALCGFKDVEYLASFLGLRTDAAHWHQVRTEFEHDLHASVVAAMARHKIDYVPGCADLGDFDATSTTIALEPAQAGPALPEPALRATFERYWSFFEKRRDGREPWDAFTPYEIRNVGAFVRLGWRDRANQLLDWFLKFQRPPGFRDWAEVVGYDEREPRFIGDMPHTWVGSDYIRSVLDMLAYERERDDTIVVGAGIPQAWIDDPSGVFVTGMLTRSGGLDFAMKRAGAGIEVRVGGKLQVPKGGIVVAPPGVTARWKATINGASAPVDSAGRVLVRRIPATLLLKP